MDGINPIVQLQPGVCRECRTPLSVVTSDLVEVTLNEEGLPVRSEVRMFLVKGICPKCLTEQAMIRKGFFYVPDTEWGRQLQYENNGISLDPKIIKGSLKENPFTK